MRDEPGETSRFKHVICLLVCVLELEVHEFKYSAGPYLADVPEYSQYRDECYERGPG
jgi:hypothetical protein